MSRALILALLLALGGCATQKLKGSGEPTPAPDGYIVDCVKHPTAERCK